MGGNFELRAQKLARKAKEKNKVKIIWGLGEKMMDIPCIKDNQYIKDFSYPIIARNKSISSLKKAVKYIFENTVFKKEMFQARVIYAEDFI